MQEGDADSEADSHRRTSQEDRHTCIISYPQCCGRNKLSSPYEDVTKRLLTPVTKTRSLLSQLRITTRRQRKGQPGLLVSVLGRLIFKTPVILICGNGASYVSYKTRRLHYFHELPGISSHGGILDDDQPQEPFGS